MTRISEVFRTKKPLIIYITAGDPNLKATEKLILELEKKGADIIELGIPFSDPLADGAVIQASHQRALRSGTTFSKIIQMIQRVRKKTKVPLVLMGDYNLFTNYGLEKFGKAALDNQIDGVVIPNLPVEESATILQIARGKNFAVIFLAALTTPLERLKKISELSSGFIYFVAVKGVTGTRKALDSALLPAIRKLKSLTSKPIAVGFGITTPIQAKKISRVADGIIIGS